jgi:hypothetical protein
MPEGLLLSMNYCPHQAQFSNEGEKKRVEKNVHGSGMQKIGDIKYYQNGSITFADGRA